MNEHEAIKLLRHDLHLTQAALAERIGVTSRAIQHYEAGTRAPEPAPLAALAGLAAQHGREKLAMVFSQAFFYQLFRGRTSQGWVSAHAERTESAWHGYLVAHVEGVELARIVCTLGSALHLAQSRNPGAREAARKLLDDFQARFRAAQARGAFDMV